MSKDFKKKEKKSPFALVPSSLINISYLKPVLERYPGNSVLQDPYFYTGQTNPLKTYMFLDFT